MTTTSLHVRLLEGHYKAIALSLKESGYRLTKTENGYYIHGGTFRAALEEVGTLRAIATSYKGQTDAVQVIVTQAIDKYNTRSVLEQLENGPRGFMEIMIASGWNVDYKGFELLIERLKADGFICQVGGTVTNPLYASRLVRGAA